MRARKPSRNNLRRLRRLTCLSRRQSAGLELPRRRVPGPRHPGDAAPARDLRVRGMPALALFEDAEAAVQRARLPEPLHLVGPELLSQQRVEEEEAEEE